MNDNYRIKHKLEKDLFYLINIQLTVKTAFNTFIIEKNLMIFLNKINYLLKNILWK